MGSVVMPMITLILTQKIGFSISEAGTLATIFMITQAPFLLLGGKLVDHMGSKKVIVIFNTLGALAYIPCSFMKPNIAMAILIAVASNLFSVAAPAYNSIVTQIVSEDKLKNAFSILYLGFNLGLAIGPALGGLLFYRHLQILFVIDAFTCFISTALVFFFIPNLHHIAEDKNLKHTEKNDAIKPQVSVYRFLFNSPSLLFYAFVLLIYYFCYSQWGYMLPLQTASIFKENSARFYSLFVSINAIAVIIFTPLLTTLTHRFRPLAIVASGGLFYAMSFLMFGNSKQLQLFFAATVVLTIGQILININSNIYIVQKTPQALIGRANSLLSLINGAGIAVGPIIMGHVLLILKYRDAWSLVALLMLCGSMAMFVLNNKKQKA
jgi:MFS family permease